MPSNEIHSGDRVGIRDGADFLHWSRTGSIIGIADYHEASDGSPQSLTVLEDGRTEAFAAPADLLVPLGPPDAEHGPGAWTAQAYPDDGDPPGQLMYFADGSDLLAFVVQFSDVLKDEKLHVHAPAWATDAQSLRLRAAGVVLV